MTETKLGKHEGCGGRVLMKEWEDPKALRKLVGPIEGVCDGCHDTVIWPDGCIL